MIALIYKGEDTDHGFERTVVGYVECASLGDPIVNQTINALVKRYKYRVGSQGLIYPCFQVTEADELTAEYINDMITE